MSRTTIGLSDEELVLYQTLAEGPRTYWDVAREIGRPGLEVHDDLMKLVGKGLLKKTKRVFHHTHAGQEVVMVANDRANAYEKEYGEPEPIEDTKPKTLDRSNFCLKCKTYLLDDLGLPVPSITSVNDHQNPERSGNYCSRSCAGTETSLEDFVDAMIEIASPAAQIPTKKVKTGAAARVVASDRIRSTEADSEPKTNRLTGDNALRQVLTEAERCELDAYERSLRDALEAPYSLRTTGTTRAQISDIELQTLELTDGFVAYGYLGNYLALPPDERNLVEALAELFERYRDKVKDRSEQTTSDIENRPPATAQGLATRFSLPRGAN